MNIRGLVAAGLIGSAALIGPATVATAPTVLASCSSSDYENIDGECIPRPNGDSSGASAQYEDGSYSYSTHRSGTCSGHGGVDQWL